MQIFDLCTLEKKPCRHDLGPQDLRYSQPELPILSLALLTSARPKYVVIAADILAPTVCTADLHHYMMAQMVEGLWETTFPASWCPMTTARPLRFLSKVIGVLSAMGFSVT